MTIKKENREFHEDMLVFDVSDVIRKRHMKINHIIYDVRPLGSAEYLKIQKQSQKIQALQIKGANSSTINEMNDIIYSLLFPLFTVSTEVEQEDGVELLEFDELMKRVKNANPIAYNSLMGDLSKTILPDAQKESERI